MAELRAERQEILARRPRPVHASRQRACALERLADTSSTICNLDGRARCFLGMSTERARAQDLDAMSQASARAQP